MYTDTESSFTSGEIEREDLDVTRQIDLRRQIVKTKGGVSRKFIDVDMPKINYYSSRVIKRARRNQAPLRPIGNVMNVAGIVNDNQNEMCQFAANSDASQVNVDLVGAIGNAYHGEMQPISQIETAIVDEGRANSVAAIDIGSEINVHEERSDLVGTIQNTDRNEMQQISPTENTEERAEILAALLSLIGGEISGFEGHSDLVGATGNLDRNESPPILHNVDGAAAIVNEGRADFIEAVDNVGEMNAHESRSALVGAVGSIDRDDIPETAIAVEGVAPIDGQPGELCEPFFD